MIHIEKQFNDYLLSVAYNMTGDLDQSLDLVQDAFLKFFALDKEISHPKFYLKRIVINQCIDFLSQKKKKPTIYPGIELATPVEDSFWEGEAKEVNNLDMAVFLLFKKCTPYERAIFVLREVYKENYREIAKTIGEKEDYCRKIYSRLKVELTDLNRKKNIPIEAPEKIINKFIKYLTENNLEELKKLFKEDIKYYVDSGGKIKGASLNVLEGRTVVAQFIISRMEKITPQESSYRMKFVNGSLGVINIYDKKTRIYINFQLSDNQIDKIFIVANPEKLRYVSP